MIIEIIFVTFLVFLDQITKYLTITFLKGQPPVQFIEGVIEFTYVENTGAAFGLFQDGTLVLTILTILILLMVLYFKYRLPNLPRYNILRFVSLFIIAGAIGNLIDRIRLGYVVDMIHFYWFSFPVFNIADISVVIGAFVMVFLLMTKYKDLDI